MKKIIVAIMALAVITVSALGFAACSNNSAVVPTENDTTEVNGIAITGAYATQERTGKVLVEVEYADMVPNVNFDPTIEVSEDNPIYVAGDIVTVEQREIKYTYTVIYVSGVTYVPAIPEEVETITLIGFYAMNGEYLYATDATHTITAAGYVDTTVFPTEAIQHLTTQYEYVTFDFAD